MKRHLPLLIGIAIIISAGFVHGRWTNRWRNSDELEQAIARLDRIPLAIGDWQGQPLELDREQLEQGEIDGYLARRYVDRKTGQAISILLVCGLPGPIAEHTPDVCYGGSGYDLTAESAQWSAPSESSQTPPAFQVGTFLKAGSIPPQALRIFWAWKADGSWQAPTDPRLAFATQPALYKLYVIRELKSPAEGIEDDPAATFLRATLLPELEKTLGGDAGTTSVLS